MADKEHQSLDVLGIKPIGDAVNTLVKGAVDGAAAFLSRICLPASEEFGLFLKDKVHNWRTKNLVQVAEKAERKLTASPNASERHAHPRIASLILENASWNDADEIQEMWAGLLASSCTENGKDDSNLIFINLLSQLSSLQIRILNFACQNARKTVSPVMGLVYAEGFLVGPEVLVEVTGIDDIHRLDRELDHLASMDLIRGGFSQVSNEDLIDNVLDAQDGLQIMHSFKAGEQKALKPDVEPLLANITPSPLAINLYVRAQGSLESPVEFFHITI